MVLNRTYQRLKDDYDTQKWWWNKRINALEEKVITLEHKNKCLLHDNQMLHQKKENLAVSLADAENTIKELQLKVGALEARWK